MGSESSSLLSSSSLVKMSEPEAANVSDDNADEEDMYESDSPQTQFAFERPTGIAKQGMNPYSESVGSG